MATNKVRVYGKAQNRTALGIVNAYMVMYPQATLDDLRKAFPDALNPDAGTKKLFQEVGKKEGSANWSGYFDKPDELITTGDGKQAALVSMWTAPSFKRLVDHAAQYGIEIAEFYAADKGIGKKGGYRLEYLNGYTPPAPSKKKSALLWGLIGLLGAALVGTVAYTLLRSPEVEVVEKTVEKTVTVVDTVYVQQIQELEKSFNATKFEQGKTDLSDDAKEVLFKLVDVMKKSPEMKLKVEGHTSSEGTAAVNQILSEARAKSVVDFLISRGIDADRLSYEGFGSSRPLNAENPEAAENRRTEFIVTEETSEPESEPESEN